MGLKWEFPGGKARKNETPEACLIRELFHRNIHHYEKKSIELSGFLVDYLSGEFVLRDHEEIRWVTREELALYDFADTDIPIVKKLSTLRFS